MGINTDNWPFHRANFAINHPKLTIWAYAAAFCLNYNTARVNLKGAKHDESCLSFDFTGLNMRTGVKQDAQPVKDKLVGKTDWPFHRANYAINHPWLVVREYAAIFGLNLSSAQKQLKGAKWDESTFSFDFSRYDLRTGKRLDSEPVKLKLRTKTDWSFHRAKYARCYHGRSTRIYALEHSLNPHTARTRLKGAFEDENCVFFDFTGYDFLTGRRLDCESAKPNNPVQLKQPGKTNWVFHRANYATNHPEMNAKEYAEKFGLNPNTARTRLKGAPEDVNCALFDFTGFELFTGKRLENELVKPTKPVQLKRPKPSKTNEMFHRANKVINHPRMTTREYAEKISVNKARNRLKAAFEDVNSALFDLIGYVLPTERRLDSKSAKPQKPVQLKQSGKTNWVFHRANYATNHPEMNAKEYAEKFGLNPNTARTRLKGAKSDELCQVFDFTWYNMRTGARQEGIADEAKMNPLGVI